jgi:hypothetical protein
MSAVKHFRELDVYQGAMSLVMRVFEPTGETVRRVGEERVGVGETQGRGGLH